MGRRAMEKRKKNSMRTWMMTSKAISKTSEVVAELVSLVKGVIALIMHSIIRVFNFWTFFCKKMNFYNHEMYIKPLTFV